MTVESWAIREAAWGGREPKPTAIEFGPWRFELRGDELADLTFDGSPVVRSVRAVARDRDWATVPAIVESVVERADGVDLQLALRGLGADIGAAIEVRADDTRFAVRLVATSRVEFLSNRFGLIVLHPPVVAGAELTIGTSSGGIRNTAFPVEVSPHQPAMDISSLAWAHDGVATTATFAGDVFEMEDQRNWTDASYKTYSTPLARPFPVVIAAGAVIEQSVEFECARVEPRRATDAATGADQVVEFAQTDHLVPAVTLGASTVPDAAFSAGGLPAGVAGLLVELDTRSPSWRAALARAAVEAGGLPLDVRIPADDPAAVHAAVAAAAASGSVARIGVFGGRGHVTEPELWEALTDAARSSLPEAELIGGARSHFTELNRQHHELPADLEGITFAMTPQMHATERAQLVESVAMQAIVVRDAVRIADGRPVHVGPITLRSRFNAVATSGGGARPATAAALAEGYGAALVEGATDPRQASVALEAWTVASFAAICAGAVAGGNGGDTGTGTGSVASVDYFETVGPRGIRDAAGPFPVARAIEEIASIAGARLLTPRSDSPNGIWIVGGARPDGSWRVLVASLADRPVALNVRHGGGERHHIVAPYEVAVLDSRD
ncbi:hypothetical protein J7E29_05110 [Streptomyces sp. ISL-90]|nr:hypothetical protein [Streptomyces sp. ISL-90]